MEAAIDQRQSRQCRCRTERFDLATAEQDAELHLLIAGHLPNVVNDQGGFAIRLKTLSHYLDLRAAARRLDVADANRGIGVVE